jgi:hypothetical protein
VLARKLQTRYIFPRFPQVLAIGLGGFSQ